MYGKRVDITFADGGRMSNVLCEREPTCEGDCYVIRLDDGRECHIMSFESMTECASDNKDEINNVV